MQLLPPLGLFGIIGVAISWLLGMVSSLPVACLSGIPLVVQRVEVPIPLPVVFCWASLGLPLPSVVVAFANWHSGGYRPLGCSDFPFCQPRLDGVSFGVQRASWRTGFFL